MDLQHTIQRMHDDMVLTAWALDKAITLGVINGPRFVGPACSPAYDAILFERGDDLPTEADIAWHLRMLAVTYFNNPEQFKNEEQKLAKTLRMVLTGVLLEWVKENPPEPGECGV